MRDREKEPSLRIKYRPYILAAVLAIAMTMFVAPEVMEGNSMAPTIESGELLICIKDSYSAKRGIPEMGQVVILEKEFSKKSSEDNIIGRVVGLPGQEIEIKDSRLYRDGKEVDLEADTGSLWLGEDKKINLEKNQVYLIGDNQKKDTDSPQANLGAVDMREIKGNVKFVIWPIEYIRSIN